jgi:hypothetical protein
MHPHSTNDVYVNYLSESDEHVHAGYGPHYQCFAELKLTYNPQNVFRRNRNIQP